MLTFHLALILLLGAIAADNVEVVHFPLNDEAQPGAAPVAPVNAPQLEGGGQATTEQRPAEAPTTNTQPIVNIAPASPPAGSPTCVIRCRRPTDLELEEGSRRRPQTTAVDTGNSKVVNVVSGLAKPDHVIESHVDIDHPAVAEPVDPLHPADLLHPADSLHPADLFHAPFLHPGFGPFGYYGPFFRPHPIFYRSPGFFGGRWKRDAEDVKSEFFRKPGNKLWICEKTCQ